MIHTRMVWSIGIHIEKFCSSIHASVKKLSCENTNANFVFWSRYGETCFHYEQKQHVVLEYLEVEIIFIFSL